MFSQICVFFFLNLFVSGMQLEKLFETYRVLILDRSELFSEGVVFCYRFSLTIEAVDVFCKGFVKLPEIYWVYGIFVISGQNPQMKKFCIL